MKLFAAILGLLFSILSSSQELRQVTFSNGANLSYFSLLVDQNVLIRVSEDGKILEWGTEVMSDRYNYYAPKLQSYMGRVEYYGLEADSVSRGKIKSIGTAYITYYGANATPEKIGKPMFIGSLQMDYYSNYEDKLLKGKLKMIGSLLLDRYSSIENEAYRGKLKSVGNTAIVYYSVFDDRVNAGKIKSIGGVQYVWYSTFDRVELRGALKSNNYRQDIAGVTYILR